jgi:hypothetical protein
MGGKMGQTPTPQPMTYLATPDFAVNEAAMKSMKSGGLTMQKGEGLFPKMFNGVDEALVASPELANLQVKLEMNPELSHGAGSTRLNRLMAQGGDPAALEGMEASGGTPKELHDTSMHEFGHAASYGQGVVPGLMEDQAMGSLRGTRAEEVLTAKAARAREIADRAMNDANLSDTHKANLAAHAHELELAAQVAPSKANYLNEGQERVGRATKIIGNATQAQVQKQPPGLIDTYAPGSLDPRLESQVDYGGKFGVPLDYYKP